MWLKLGAAGQPATRAYPIQLLSGRIDVWIPKRKHPETAILVRARRKVNAVAKGGHSVIFTAGRSLTTGAVDQPMLVAVGNDWRPLPAGHARTFGPQDPRGDRWRSIVSAPRAHVNRPLQIALPGSSSGTTATWTNVPGAARYQITLSRTDETGTSVVREVSTRLRSMKLGSLGAGRYKVSVRAVDGEGLEGPSSPPVSVRVIGVRLPAGAFFAGRAIELAPGRSVHFENVRGLQVSYGQASAFVPAPEDIGLTRGRAATLVRFRRQGETAETRVLLEPKVLHADVVIGPELARWPTDRVVVTVRVFDERGDAVPGWVRILPKVTVNVDPVFVHWVRHANTMTAVVPPPTGPGPWVVRVEVSDQFGEHLGRNFLVVAPGRALISPGRVAYRTATRD